jgi:hypothetical protein
MHAASRGAPAPAAFVERLVKRLREMTNASVVFGEPVERDGTTVIAVAGVRREASGGAGDSATVDCLRDAGKVGQGGGAGLSVPATGYIELRDGRGRFVRTVGPVPAWPPVLASAAAAWLVARGLPAPVR